jgi:hypothetical protein
MSRSASQPPTARIGAARAFWRSFPKRSNAQQLCGISVPGDIGDEPHPIARRRCARLLSPESS